MPYIKKEDRTWARINPQTAGELNYAITMIVKEFLAENPNYQRFNDVIGALEGCKLEVYRRLVAPYEDVKIKENGDVF